MKKNDVWKKGLPERWRLPIALVLVGAVAWSVFLIAQGGDSKGTFGLLVRTMGSIGILYLLFLVTRPSSGGNPDVRALLRKEQPSAESDVSETSRARWAIVTITLALAIAGVVYRVVQETPFHQSALFFVGVPAVLAITLALTPKAKSATGMIVRGITLALLLSGVVLYEGFICIAMAAPLFYLVGILIGAPIDRARRKKSSEGRVYSLVGLGLLVLSLEGATPATSFSTREVVRAERTVDVSAAQIRAALARTPSFDEALPFYLKLGFPRPVAARGRGLAVGDRRTIFFGDESPMEPIAAAHEHHLASSGEGGGVLKLEIVRRGPGLVVFEPVVDATAFTHWISWGRSAVRWSAVDADTTEVSWTLHFERKLSPSWYFGPWQRYAAEKAAGYLIETVALP